MKVFRGGPCKKGSRGNILVIALIAALAVAIVVGIALMGGLPFGQGPPHIILISIDTLRHDHLGFAGHESQGTSASPFIDQLARKGVVFTHAVSSSSWTLPGHYSLLTGLPSELHEMVDDRIPYSSQIQTLAEDLRKKGYATGGFYSGPYLHDFFGFHRGFDTYESCMSGETLYDRFNVNRQKLSREQKLQEAYMMEKKSHEDVTSNTVTDKALYFARKNREKPMFVFLHYFDVHNDYIPPEPFRSRFSQPGYNGWVNGRHVVRDARIHKDMKKEDLDQLRSLYDGEIAWVDFQLQRFFKMLKKEDPKIMDRTIVIVTSDHGEEFFEHDNLGHRFNVYGETLRIPLLFRIPGDALQGTRVDDPVRIYDIYPTLLDLAGFAPPKNVFGRSLTPLMSGTPLAPEPILSELTYIPDGQQDHYLKHFAYQYRNLKLIGLQKRAWSDQNPIDFTGKMLEESYELYDLNKDPSERENLFLSQPKLAEGLLSGYGEEIGRLQQRHRELYKDENRSATQVPENLKEKIEQSGYGAGARKNK